jgi:hypothetical protein
MNGTIRYIKYNLDCVALPILTMSYLILNVPNLIPHNKSLPIVSSRLVVSRAGLNVRVRGRRHTMISSMLHFCRRGGDGNEAAAEVVDDVFGRQDAAKVDDCVSVVRRVEW